MGLPSPALFPTEIRRRSIPSESRYIHGQYLIITADDTEAPTCVLGSLERMAESFALP